MYLHSRNPGGPSHQDDLINVLQVQLCVLQSPLHGDAAPAQQQQLMSFYIPSDPKYRTFHSFAKTHPEAIRQCCTKDVGLLQGT